MCRFGSQGEPRALSRKARAHTPPPPKTLLCPTGTMLGVQLSDLHGGTLALESEGCTVQNAYMYCPSTQNLTISLQFRIRKLSGSRKCRKTIGKPLNCTKTHQIAHEQSKKRVLFDCSCENSCFSFKNHQNGTPAAAPAPARPPKVKKAEKTERGQNQIN
jgi:hypothetical protein